MCGMQQNERRGAAMIQRSVSLDDEDDANCTITLPGMHKNLDPWWSRVNKRWEWTDDFLHQLTNKMSTSKDKEYLDTLMILIDTF